MCGNASRPVDGLDAERAERQVAQAAHRPSRATSTKSSSPTSSIRSSRTRLRATINVVNPEVRRAVAFATAHGND
jgi:hypothetical protein